jgi:hypothetical protein
MNPDSKLTYLKNDSAIEMAAPSPGIAAKGPALIETAYYTSIENSRPKHRSQRNHFLPLL